MGKLLLTLEKHPRALCRPALGVMDVSRTRVFPVAQPGHLAGLLKNPSSAAHWAYLPVMSAGRNAHLHMQIIE